MRKPPKILVVILNLLLLGPCPALAEDNFVHSIELQVPKSLRNYRLNLKPDREYDLSTGRINMFIPDYTKNPAQLIGDDGGIASERHVPYDGRIFDFMRPRKVYPWFRFGSTQLPQDMLRRIKIDDTIPTLGFSLQYLPNHIGIGADYSTSALDRNRRYNQNQFVSDYKYTSTRLGLLVKYAPLGFTDNTILRRFDLVAGVGVANHVHKLEISEYDQKISSHDHENSAFYSGELFLRLPLNNLLSVKYVGSPTTIELKEIGIKRKATINEITGGFSHAF